jgi:hypothetical protein
MRSRLVSAFGTAHGRPLRAGAGVLMALGCVACLVVGVVSLVVLALRL